MFKLQKLKQMKLAKKDLTGGRVSVRDKLLVKGKLC